MHRTRIGKAVMENKGAVKYAFEAKEAHLTLFFNPEKQFLKEGIMDVMHHLGVATINNDRMGTLSFKLSSPEDADGLEATVKDILNSFEYDVLTDPIFPNEKNWLMNENSVFETFIGSVTFDGKLPSDKVLLEKRLDLQKEHMYYRRFGFHELRTYFTHEFVNISDKDFIESIVKDTMELTDFFEKEEDAHQFVSFVFEKLTEEDYRQLGFLEFRLNLLCEQIMKRLEATKGKKVTNESPFKKALLNDKNPQNENLFSLPTKENVTPNLPIDLFAKKEVIQKGVDSHTDKSKVAHSISEKFGAAISFKEVYLSNLKLHKQTISEIDKVHDIKYVNNLYTVIDNYLLIKAGFSLMNQIIRYSKDLPEQTFEEFIQSFNLK